MIVCPGGTGMIFPLPRSLFLPSLFPVLFLSFHSFTSLIFLSVTEVVSLLCRIRLDDTVNLFAARALELTLDTKVSGRGSPACPSKLLHG